MSWESEFTTQWQSSLSIIETLIREQIKKDRQLHSNSTNKIIKSEIEKWSLSTHYNGAWLRNLTRQYPDLAMQFRTTLEELNVSDEISFRSGLPILPILVSIVFMGVIFFGLSQVHLLNDSLPRIAELLKQLNDNLLRKSATTILIGLTTFSILNTVYNQKKNNKIKKLIEIIKLNFQETGRNLSHIVSMADELDRKNKQKN